MAGEDLIAGAAALASGPVGAAVFIGAKLLGFGLKRSAKKKRKAAQRLQRINTQLRNVQARRQFVRAARGAQANALVAGAASGASLDSSGAQGNLASLQTQENVGLTEQKNTQVRNFNSRVLGDKADKRLATAGALEDASNAFQSFGSTFG
jgi:hypothetical protein